MSETLQTPELDKRNIEWSQLIEHALTVPGSLGNTYNRFYNYSFMNQILLYMQGVQEPVATYKRWQELGRQVQKGSKAKFIMRPMFKKDDKDETKQKLIGFKYVNCLFSLSETDGDELPPFAPPKWEPAQALEALDIQEVPFENTNGNIQGYSFERNFALNPIAQYPLKTMFHELAHIVLKHTDQDVAHEHRGVQEFQAEASAYLIMNELEADHAMSASESRAYIQHWLSSDKPDDKAIRQVFGCVETILKAGRP